MKRITIVFPAGLICLSLLVVASSCGGEDNPFDVKSELVTDAKRPVALAFAPDGRLFYAEEHTGNIRIIDADGELLEEPFINIDVLVYLEWALTGLALDPDFEANHYVYTFFTDPTNREGDIGRPVVMRFTDQNSRGVKPRVIVGDLPEVGPGHHFNANGSIHFGLDGFLYMTLGDYDLGFSQDLSIPQGKILRVNKEDGTAAPTNPFVGQSDVDPRTFAYGFHEAFDFAIHPQTGRIYGSDNTPVTCEELNIIEAGANYEWPDVGNFPFSNCDAGTGTKGIHFFVQEGMEPEHFLSQVVVSGLEFVSGDIYPLLGDSLLACEWKTKLMRRLVLSGPELDRVTADDVVVKDCDMDIAVSPEGIIYYSNERQILRLVPK